jgi:hypothetical protein
MIGLTGRLFQVIRKIRRTRGPRIIKDHP